MRCDFRHSVGTRSMIRPGEDRLPSRGFHGRLDPFVFRRHNYSRSVPRPRRSLKYMLNHGFAKDLRQRLARKPDRRVSRRNNDQDYGRLSVHGVPLKSFAGNVCYHDRASASGQGFDAYVPARSSCFEMTEWYNPPKIFEWLPGAFQKLQ
jgi:hypothetical protein